MGFIKDIKEIKTTLNEIASDTLEKARKYDELMKYLSKIKLELEKAALSYNQDGTYNVKVNYKMPYVLLSFDGDGNVIQNERFTAINMLNLISIDDMMKISEVINEAKNKNISND